MQLEYTERESKRVFSECLDLAQRGDMNAKARVAAMYRSGIGTERDLHQAAYWYQQAYEGGALNCAFDLGEIHEELKKFEKALDWYKNAAERGRMLAYWRLALLHRVDSDLVDGPAALHWLQRAADAGHLPSKFLLLRQMWNGRIVGGKVRSLFGLAAGVFDMLKEAVTGKLRADAERLKK